MTSSQVEPALAPDIPVDAIPRCQRARHVLTQPLLKRRPPWHQLETHPIVDHGEPPRRECDAPAIDARDVLAFRRWATGEPRVGRQFRGDLIELAPAKRTDEIASEDDPLALPSSHILFDEMIDPLVHRFADFGTEAAAGERGHLGEKLTVDPGGARRRDLRLDREVDRVASDRRLLPPASS